jgi:AcrR family transcriptional regulator
MPSAAQIGEVKPMNKRDLRRQQLLERMADYVLAHGLQGASLRPLAAAAGTSDRMLLHYFADKDELLTATLNLVTQRLVTLLDSARTAPMPFQHLLPYLAIMLKDVQIQPYMRLWFALLTGAVEGTEPYRTIARRILTTFAGWIASALHVDDEADRAPMAALTFAIIEGLSIFDALGDDGLRADALAVLARSGVGLG